jgi:hypothetical protein
MVGSSNCDMDDGAMAGGNWREIAVGLFDELVCRGAGVVEVVSGREPAVLLQGEPKLLSRIYVRSNRMRLVVVARTGAYPSVMTEALGRRTRVIVVVDELSKLRVQGFASVVLGESQEAPLKLSDLSVYQSSGGAVRGWISATRLKLRLRSHGQMELAGDVRFLDAGNSALGSIDCTELVSQRCRASVTGMGTVSVMVLDELDARLSGAGSISYRGDPVVRRRPGGVGRVEHIS